MSNQPEKESLQSDRRRFLAGGATAIAGLAGLRAAAVRAQTTDPLPAVGTWPWPSTGLDAVATARSSTTGLQGCATTTFGLVVRALGAQLGPDSPWAMVPPQLASAFNGGGPYGSDCGSLQGGILLMTLVGAPITLKQEYYKWYCDFPFPSDEWDDLYTVADTIQTVSRSPLCHESRSIWEGVFLRTVYPSTGVYDSTRCSKLVRDCTKKTVELINDFKLAGYVGVWQPDRSFEACVSCHTDLYAAKEPGGIASGKEDCNRCHQVSRRHPRGR
jgi:hypothetical protein